MAAAPGRSPHRAVPQLAAEPLRRRCRRLPLAAASPRAAAAAPFRHRHLAAPPSRCRPGQAPPRLIGCRPRPSTTAGAGPPRDWPLRPPTLNGGSQTHRDWLPESLPRRSRSGHVRRDPVRRREITSRPPERAVGKKATGTTSNQRAERVEHVHQTDRAGGCALPIAKGELAPNERARISTASWGRSAPHRAALSACGRCRSALRRARGRVWAALGGGGQRLSCGQLAPCRRTVRNESWGGSPAVRSCRGPRERVPVTGRSHETCGTMAAHSSSTAALPRSAQQGCCPQKAAGGACPALKRRNAGTAGRESWSRCGKCGRSSAAQPRLCSRR